MRFVLLGPVQATHEDQPLRVGRAQRRAVLAYLLLHSGRCVPVIELIDALWDGAAPATSRTQIFASISAIRRVLSVAGTERVATTTAGYQVRVRAGELDLAEFRELVGRSHRQAEAGQVAAAVETLRQALALFGGSPLSGITGSFVESAQAGIEADRLAALERLYDMELRLGRHLEVTTELAEVAQLHPLRESFTSQLMLALYRGGRQAEALEAYRTTRERLVGELGVEPGPDLMRMHRAVLAADPGLLMPVVAADPGPRARNLPRDIPDFTGREPDLAWLDQVTRAGAASVLAVVSGMAGVGKTALAVHWAHRRAHLFPDGQLYVNLRGYDEADPVPTIDAIAQLLVCLGVSTRDIPPEVDRATAMLRSRLAGRRVLMILDNARTPAQIRELMPGDAGCTVVVTSRDRLLGLLAADGAVRQAVGILPDRDAAHLLTRLIGEERVRAEPDAARELAVACGGLPLALRIAAAHLADRPETMIAEYTGGLTVSALAVEGDEGRAVATVLGHSVDALPEAARRSLRLLGVVPGPSFTADTVAALAGVDLGAARAQLETLQTASLVDEVGKGRFATHDLVRGYARATLDDPEAEFKRYLAYLTHVTQAADALHSGSRPDPAASSWQPGHLPPLSSAAEAMAWMDAELGGIVAAVDAACTRGEFGAAVAIALALPQFLHTAGYPGQIVSLYERVLAAGGDRLDLAARTRLRHTLAGAYVVVGRGVEAAVVLRECIEVRESLGDELGAARSRSNLAYCLEHLGRYDEALEAANAALAVYRRLSEPRELGWYLSHTRANILVQLGRIEDAHADLAEALLILREHGTPTQMTRVLNNIGGVCQMLHRHDEALVYLNEALELARAHTDRLVEAHALASISVIHYELGDLPSAIDLRAQAVERSRRYGIVTLTSESLMQLAKFKLAAEDRDGSLADYREALELAEQMGNEHLRASAMAGIGRITGDPEVLAAALSLLDTVSPDEAGKLREHLRQDKRP